jgi:regulator of protease activity HflC (stomatin/prohibitin superfamily)
MNPIFVFFSGHPYVTGFLWFVLIVILVSIKQINQYEKGVKFTFGKYIGLMEPGWRLIFPVVQSYHKIDLRVKAVDVPNQEAITKDNISVSVNAVIYYKVHEADKVVLEVENFYYAISQLAQTTMRNAVGQVDLDGLLSQRDRVSESIRSIIDKETDPWGIKVLNVELKDITLPEEMKRVIGKQAEAEREKRAIIIKAEGEVMAANNMAKAAEVLGGSKGALHLRTLQSINDISSDQSNTIVFAIPLEVLRAFEAFGKNNPEDKPKSIEQSKPSSAMPMNPPQTPQS